jgi:hypothetical protein
MGHEDVRVGLGGAVGLRGTGLFSLEGALVLTLPSSGPAFLLTSLEIGHQCHFLALQDMNLCPLSLHCQYGWPLAASSATFQCSHLNVQFLLHESHLFSFWACIASCVPFMRLKKAKGPLSLRSSKI